MNFDYAIVGGGIVGLSVARELTHRAPKAKIALFEKEPEIGLHASGRNSGVLHSGIYYSPGSLKARFCAEGARVWKEYCRDRGLPLKETGKIVLPVSADQDTALDLLFERGRANGAEPELIDGKSLADMEPEARTATGRALWVRQTAVIDSREILRSLRNDLSDVEFIHGRTRFESRAVVVQGQRYEFGELINCAGLWADKVAQAYGAGDGYTMLPIRGRYFKHVGDLAFRHQIYPVPDLNVPFLGVHFTLGIDCAVYLGPSALPALGREHYRGLSGATLRSAGSNIARIARLFMANRNGFRTYFWRESRRAIRSQFAREARQMVPRLRTGDLQACEKVGIRAQLVDLKSQSLAMDFVIERGERSLHVLNAVSPGFTCAPSFARHIVDRLLESKEKAWTYAENAS